MVRPARLRGAPDLNLADYLRQALATQRINPQQSLLTQVRDRQSAKRLTFIDSAKPIASLGIRVE